MGLKRGFSFSWRRALGISAFKGRIAKATGIPTTASGLERKVGRFAMKGCLAVLILLALAGGVMYLAGRLFR
jgi:hypothetical protein